MSAEQPVIAVFDLNFPCTISFVRSLSKSGAKFRTYNPNPMCVARFSRHVKEVHRCPPMGDHLLFPAWLKQKLDEGEFDVIAPTSDMICYHIAQSLDLINPTFHRAYPTKEAYLDVLLKDRLTKRSEALGIPVPWTYLPTSLEQIMDESDDLHFPLLFKPRSHVFSPNERGGVIWTRAQVQEYFREYEVPDNQKPFLEQFPDAAWPVLQHYVGGGLIQASCSGMLGTNGDTIASAMAKKIDQSPPQTGIGTAFLSDANPELEQHSLNAVRQLIGRGLFEVEFVRETQESTPQLIDINARTFGQMDFDMKRGNDLPALWHESLFKEPECENKPLMEAVCIHTVPFTLSNLTRIISGPYRSYRLKRVLRILKKKVFHHGVSRFDPIALLAFTLRMLRYPQTYIRPHIRERMSYEHFDEESF